MCYDVMWVIRGKHALYNNLYYGMNYEYDNKFLCIFITLRLWFIFITHENFEEIEEDELYVPLIRKHNVQPYYIDEDSTKIKERQLRYS